MTRRLSWNRLAAAWLIGGTILAGAAAPAPAHAGAPVDVLYAGSLVALNEQTVGPAFTKTTGYGYQGEGMGSVAAANLIKARLRTPDIFESADPTVNTQDLSDAANGNYVSWYFVFGSTRLVLAYNPHSRFAADFQHARQGTVPWYTVLEQPGLRLGRTDPRLDPKGYFTLMMAQLATRYYHVPNLSRRLFGAPDNAAQIFPEETLVARLAAGQLDAAILYLTEAVAQHLPYLRLPPQIDLGETAYAATYATATYTSQGKVHHGTPVLYTVTIPRTAHNLLGAEAFVRFIVAGKGRTLYQQGGVLPTRILVGGNARTVPPALVGLIQGHYAG
jgi:molybdate/tungstate transport system substrate-binding protein